MRGSGTPPALTSPPTVNIREVEQLLARSRVPGFASAPTRLESWQRALPLIGGADLDPPAQRSQLPPNFEHVLARRRAPADCSVRAYRCEDPTGGSLSQVDLTRAFRRLVRGAWPAQADTLLVQLATRYRGYTPQVFGNAVPGLFPHLEQACQQALAGTRFDPNELAYCTAPHAGAVGFGRLRMLARWEPFPERPCSLCGARVEPNSQWESEVARYGPPRWCRACLLSASGTASASREEALTAAQHFTQLTGAAPRSGASLRAFPQDLPGPMRDAMFAARMALPYSGWLKRIGLAPWPQFLASAGVAPDQVLTARGTQSAAADGHWCLSLFERDVDDFLSSRGIAHDREPHWPRHPQWNPSGQRRADWRLADGTMVEAAGMLGEKVYAAKMADKRKLADALGIRLLVITPEDLSQLEVPFLPWLHGTAH